MSGAKLPELARPAANPPKAARDQLDIQAWESGLVDLARVHHPTVKWWHGYRKAEERYGSYCYICERFIVTWDPLSKIPQQAVDQIAMHKTDHFAGNNASKSANKKASTR